MTNRQIFEAYSENYRQISGLSNEDLADKIEKLYNAKLSDLSSTEDILFKAAIEDAKKEFAKNGYDPLQSMKDAVLNRS